MTLYTNMPIETVLDGLYAERKQCVEVRIGEMLLQVTPIAPGFGTIERILQSPLEQYLNPSYMPGMVVHYGINGSMDK